MLKGQIGKRFALLYAHCHFDEGWNLAQCTFNITRLQLSSE